MAIYVMQFRYIYIMTLFILNRHTTVWFHQWGFLYFNIIYLKKSIGINKFQG
jgi:N-acetylglutamate synthase-like GNAT family acetyltransferase